MKAFILTGSREWTDADAICDVLRPMLTHHAIMIHGAHGCPADWQPHEYPPAKSADAIADDFYMSQGGTVIRMPAQWERLGNAAGPERNRDMLAVLVALWRCGYEVSVEAFSLPKSRGTKNMKVFASCAGVQVNEHGRTE